MPSAKSSARRDIDAERVEKIFGNTQQKMDTLSVSIAILYYFCGIRIVPDIILGLDFTA